MYAKVYRKEYFSGKRPRWRPVLECDTPEQAMEAIACLKGIYYRLRAGEYAHAEYGMKVGRRVRPA